MKPNLNAKKNKSNETIKRLWNYFKYEKKRIIIVMILVILSTLASVSNPALMLVAIDNFITKGNLEGLLWIVWILVILSIITTFFEYFSKSIMVKVSETTLYRIRKELFEHLEHLSLSFFDSNKKGDLMSRFTNDFNAISETLSDVLIEALSSSIMLIGTTIMMFIINPILAITTILTVPLFFTIVFKLGSKIGKLHSNRQKVLGELTAYAEERIGGIQVVKSYGKEKETLEEFKLFNEDFKETSRKAVLYSSMMMPANIAITNLSNILLISVGSILTIKGYATVGSILAFLSYSRMFRRPINQLAVIYTSIQSALAGAERIFAIIDQEIEIKDVDYPIELGNVKGNVEFIDVSFGYEPNKLVLKNINLDVKKGENIAFVGPTGAGKTTIINLLTRFYDVNLGVIKIDDKDISQVRKHELRKNIGIVLQDTYLFKGTVLDNIKYGKRDATVEEVIEACKKSQAHAFIRRLPDGYNSEVLEEGSNFSQGQRQLIAIARAILANPSILILDEATSNVDTRTEVDIQRGMEQLMKGKTSFIIAHRLSTIVNADKIIVINNGEIVEQGKHDELIKSEGFYYNLYKSQFDK